MQSIELIRTNLNNSTTRVLARIEEMREHCMVPPTAQNQGTIEDDLRALAPQLATLPLEDATWRAEQAVRNYDPCISCATHFLKLRFEEAS